MSTFRQLSNEYSCGHISVKKIPITPSEAQKNCNLWTRIRTWGSKSSDNIKLDKICPACEKEAQPKTEEELKAEISMRARIAMDQREKHAPPSLGIDATIVAIARAQDKESIDNLQRVQRMARVRSKGRNIDRLQRLKAEEYARQDLETAARYWETLHAEHEQQIEQGILAGPKGCPACAEHQVMMTDRTFRMITDHADVIYRGRPFIHAEEITTSALGAGRVPISATKPWNAPYSVNEEVEIAENVEAVQEIRAPEGAEDVSVLSSTTDSDVVHNSSQISGTENQVRPLVIDPQELEDRIADIQPPTQEVDGTDLVFDFEEQYTVPSPKTREASRLRPVNDDWTDSGEKNKYEGTVQQGEILQVKSPIPAEHSNEDGTADEDIFPGVDQVIKSPITDPGEDKFSIGSDSDYEEDPDTKAEPKHPAPKCPSEKLKTENLALVEKETAAAPYEDNSEWGFLRKSKLQLIWETETNPVSNYHTQADHDFPLLPKQTDEEIVDLLAGIAPAEGEIEKVSPNDAVKPIYPAWDDLTKASESEHSSPKSIYPPWDDPTLASQPEPHTPSTPNFPKIERSPNTEDLPTSEEKAVPWFLQAKKPLDPNTPEGISALQSIRQYFSVPLFIPDAYLECHIANRIADGNDITWGMTHRKSIRVQDEEEKKRFWTPKVTHESLDKKVSMMFLCQRIEWEKIARSAWSNSTSEYGSDDEEEEGSKKSAKPADGKSLTQAILDAGYILEGIEEPESDEDSEKSVKKPEITWQVFATDASPREDPNSKFHTKVKSKLCHMEVMTDIQVPQLEIKRPVAIRPTPAVPLGPEEDKGEVWKDAVGELEPLEKMPKHKDMLGEVVVVTEVEAFASKPRRNSVSCTVESFEDEYEE